MSETHKSFLAPLRNVDDETALFYIAQREKTVTREAFQAVEEEMRRRLCETDTFRLEAALKYLTAKTW